MYSMSASKKTAPKYPGIPVATNGNELVAYYTEARVADAGIFYPITPSTEMGEHFQLSFARGELNVFGNAKVAVETEGEHAAQAGAIEEGGAFVWESAETDDAKVWERIPRKHRQMMIDKKIRLFAMDGFKIARESTDRSDLEYRMQSNSFLGAFFKVSSFLADHRIPTDAFLESVHDQYEKKFGRFGEAVVASNMLVMRSGFEQVRQVKLGAADAKDTSSMRVSHLVPLRVGRDNYPWLNSLFQDGDSKTPLVELLQD